MRCVVSYTLSIQVLCISLTFCLGEITQLINIEQCLAEHNTHQWDNRAADYCTDAKYYHCLVDESKGSTFYEFCSPPVKIDKGYYPTFNHNVNQIIPKNCPLGQFQAIKDISSHLLNKCDNKQPCDDTGQTICEEEDATKDRLCMCKYMEGFARNDYYGENPNKTEICCPIVIPCKCSKPDSPCKDGYELNAASQCVAKCEDGYHRPLKTLDCVKTTDIITVGTQSTTSPSSIPRKNNTADDGNRQSDDNSRHVLIGAICGALFALLLTAAIIVLIVAVRKGWCRRWKRKKIDIRNGKNGPQYQNGQKKSKTVIFNIKNAKNVQIGDNANANFFDKSDGDDASQGGESNGSDFAGFPRKSQLNQSSNTNSLPGAVQNSYEAVKPIHVSTTFKETYHKNFKALSKAAMDRGLMVQDVPGDGNCMYNSALLQLKDNQPTLTVDEMRKHVQKFIESNPSTPSDVTYKSLLSALDWKPGPKSKQHEEYRKLQQNKNLEESQREELLFQIYLNEVRENEWGDPFTLHALSQIYNVDIDVLSSHNLNDFTRTTVVENPKMTIRLGHLAVNGEDLHYVALLPYDGSADHDADISDIKLEDKDLPPHGVKSEDNTLEENEVTEPLLSK